MSAPGRPCVIGLLAILDFIPGVRDSLSTGMTGFDSTWYHGPFAAGFHQTGNTWDLHFIAPQFLAWFYPANAEIFHAVGMLAFDRDLLSPLLNLGWFIGCLFALWGIGRPRGVGVFSVLLGALILRAPLLADQAGEARNDIVAIFFLLAAVAVVLNAASRSSDGGRPAAATGRCSSPASRPGSRPGPSSTTSSRAFVLAGRDRAWPPRAAPGGARSGSAASPRSPEAATGICGTSPTPATRCPGSPTSARSPCPAPTRPSAAAKGTASSAT